MGNVFVAFTAIWAVTGVGWLLGRFGLLGPEAETVLARLVFFVATPALLFVTLSASRLADLLSPILATYVLSAVAVAGVTVALSRLVWRLSPGETVIAALGSAYVNAANLGIPVAAYVFGDFSVVAPVLLFQLLLAAPVALAVLESLSTSDSSVTAGAVVRVPLAYRLLLLPVRNPILLASAAGLALAVLAWRPPADVLRPLELIGQAAVPTALLALGLSLGTRTLAAALPSATAGRPVVTSLVALKVIVQPVLAYLIGRYGLDLRGRVLLGAVIMSGLPTAQNVFVFASRYRQGVALGRNAVFGSTVVAFLTLGAFAQLLSG